MANDEVLGPRKTIFVLVIVVGCFAVLWPRILSPLIIGHTQEHLKPNQFDREAGCCEVMFESEIAVLELVNEVCSSAIGVGGKLSPYLATECRKAVNETCGVDIAAFLKRNDNVGKTTKTLVETMKNSNGSCLKEHFGVQLSSLNTHPALNSWVQEDTLKQERSSMRGMGPHPALRERGRAIPPGVPQPAQQRPPTQLPPHIRPPPIPGMRPPLGAPGGPVPAPKSSMGFVMPIYTICIIVFFVYTLSKILFKRTGSPYENVAPDPHFRRRVFRDDSRSSPDKLGPKERDAIVTAISGLVAEVRQQMEASDAQCQQRQEAQDNTARPYTNGTILLNSGPVQIIASEFQDSKEKTQEEHIQSSEQKDSIPETDLLSQAKEPSENNVDDLSKREIEDDLLIESIEEEAYPVHKEFLPEPEVIREKSIPNDNNEHLKDLTQEKIVIVDEEQLTKNKEGKEVIIEKETHESDIKETHEFDIKETVNANLNEDNTEKLNGDNLCEDKVDLIALSEDVNLNKETDLVYGTELFIQEEKGSNENEEKSTPELLEEALKEVSPNDQEEQEDNQENSSVKVLGMEVTAHAADGGAWPGSEPPVATAPPTQPHKPPHEADDVKSIFLETEIPQQTRVLVADFAENRTDRTKPKHAPLVVSGKMTLSLIQDAPRETPERDPESTVDDYTTASAATHPLAEKEEDLSEEEIEEEIEIEEIEEEVEDEEDEEDENEPKTGKV